MSEHKTAAQLIREAAERDPQAHDAALARGYGIGGPVTGVDVAAGDPGCYGSRVNAASDLLYEVGAWLHDVACGADFGAMHDALDGRLIPAADAALAELRTTRDALAEAEWQRDEALAKIAAVDALAEKWERGAGPESRAWAVFGPQVISVPFAVEHIRAALRPPTATVPHETAQPRVPGTTGPQNRSQGRGSAG